MKQQPRYIIIDDTELVLSDYRYWTDHEQSLTDFCNKHNCLQTGMLVKFPSSSVQTLFILTYSN